MPSGDIGSVTCNSNGYCAYRTYGVCGWGCCYGGYCDYQLPRDSRGQLTSPITPECTCGQTGTIPCPIHGIGGKI